MWTNAAWKAQVNGWTHAGTEFDAMVAEGVAASPPAPYNWRLIASQDYFGEDDLALGGIDAGRIDGATVTGTSDHAGITVANNKLSISYTTEAHGTNGLALDITNGQASSSYLGTVLNVGHGECSLNTNTIDTEAACTAAGPGCTVQNAPPNQDDCVNGGGQWQANGVWTSTYTGNFAQGPKISGNTAGGNSALPVNVEAGFEYTVTYGDGNANIDGTGFAGGKAVVVAAGETLQTFTFKPCASDVGTYVGHCFAPEAEGEEFEDPNGGTCGMFKVVANPGIVGEFAAATATAYVGKQSDYLTYTASVQGNANTHNQVDIVKNEGTAGETEFPAGSTLVVTKGINGENSAKSVAKVNWLPQWKQGGQTYTFCVTATDAATDAGCRAQSASVGGCATVSVKRCVYKAQGTEHNLRTVAAQIGLNWMQLWALNPTISQPAASIADGTSIKTGHTFNVKAGDSLSRVASLFGTTPQTLLDANADIVESTFPSAEHIANGICVVPNGCRVLV